MKNYHFIGIKGSGMSALAHILFDEGNNVQGSDVSNHYFTQISLEEKGIKIYNFGESEINQDMIVIVGNAFSDTHDEVVEAYQKGLKVYRYHEFLGEWMKKFITIAVSGAHGKTSTTGLTSHILQHIKPTSYLIGDGTGKGTKDGQYFVFEACEYKRHFLAYEPDYTIITNIDFDHPDYFKDIEDVKDAYESFIKQTKKEIIGCGEDIYIKELSERYFITTYGFSEENVVQAYNIKQTNKGTNFKVKYEGSYIGSFEIPMFGRHHVLNALAMLTVCVSEGLNIEEIQEHLDTYQGVKRRFNEEILGDNVVVDDYAHHPTEIKATIETANLKYPNKEVIAVFQPHTYTRTNQFLDEFAESLSLADKVYLCDIFGSAREDKGQVSIENLIEKVPNGQHLTLDNIEILNKYNKQVLLFMGAGDIQKYIEKYKESIKANI